MSNDKSGNINTSVSSEPSTLIAMAVQQGLEVEKLEKLLELQERWEAKEAKKQFLDSLSKFQAEVPEIKKSKAVNFGDGKAKYKYAQLADIDEAIKEPLAKNGLAKTFQITEENGRIYVSCKISHVAGHSETTTMSGASDNTGSKNAIQASGSTITYLQRYTLIGALGLTTADEDNDGNKLAEEKKEPVKKTVINVQSLPVLDPITKIMKASTTTELSEIYNNLPLEVKTKPEVVEALSKKKAEFQKQWVEQKKLENNKEVKDNTEIIEGELIDKDMREFLDNEKKNGTQLEEALKEIGNAKIEAELDEILTKYKITLGRVPDFMSNLTLKRRKIKNESKN